MNDEEKKKILPIKRHAILENIELSTWKHGLESTDTIIIAISKLQLAFSQPFRELINM